MDTDRMRMRRAIARSVVGLFLAACIAAPIAPPPRSSAVMPSPSPPVPVVTVEGPRDPRQAPRYVSGRWSATVPVLAVVVDVSPRPSFACTAAVDPGRESGTFRCAGLLPAATEATVRVSVTSGQGVRVDAIRTFRTMGDRLSGVPWFTEFEDPTGEAIACAAASVRIIQTFTTGRDVATAARVLALARPLNKSADPGIDPAAIAAVIAALEPTNRYHYYRFRTREEATVAAAYWLARSAKPVIALSLAGQHGPVIVGYSGTLEALTGLVVEDPQRGDVDPLTAKHRPDKSRSVEFQTGKLVGLDEWYRDDWWFRDAYKGAIVFNADAKIHDVDRNDGAYARPHWDGTFVIVVDDGDAENPPDREGRMLP